MLNIEKAFTLAAWQFSRDTKNPRTIMCGIMAFLLSFMLSDHVTTISSLSHQTNVQLFELFPVLFGQRQHSFCCLGADAFAICTAKP